MSRFNLLRCSVGRTVVDHHNAIHTFRHCLDDLANEFRFILGRNNDADVPSFLHRDSSLPQVMNLTSLPIGHRPVGKTVQVMVCLRGFIGRRHGLQSVADIPLRIVLLGRDIELRIVSLIVRAREVADDVVFLDLGSNDTTVELAQEVGCTSLHFTESLNPKEIAFSCEIALWTRPTPHSLFMSRTLGSCKTSPFPSTEQGNCGTSTFPTLRTAKSNKATKIRSFPRSNCDTWS